MTDDWELGMGRKRLLTILAAVTAAVTIQVGPAAATDHCLVLGEDILKLSAADPEDCVVDALTGEVLKEAEPITEPVEDTTEKTTETVEKTTEKTTETVEKTTEAVTGGSTGTAPAPTQPPTSEPTTPAPSDGETSSTGGTSPERRTADSSDVRASGDARQPRAWDAAREGHLDALRAIRSDLAASSPLERGMAGPVQPFGGPTSTDLDLAAPEVADAGVVAGEDERLTPEVAPAEQDAVLATSSPMRDLAEAPLALKLLAAALVLGSGAVWTIASRELGNGPSTTA